jgi:hypothetical protein
MDFMTCRQEVKQQPQGYLSIGVPSETPLLAIFLPSCFGGTVRGQPEKTTSEREGERVWKKERRGFPIIAPVARPDIRLSLGASVPRVGPKP